MHKMWKIYCTYKKTLSNITSIYLWLYSPLLNLGRFFSFLIFHTVCRTPWIGDQPISRQLPVHMTAQTSMPQGGFEPTIPVFERAKTVHALDHAATVIGRILHHTEKQFK
jgi:hypothetical protein